MPYIQSCYTDYSATYIVVCASQNISILSYAPTLNAGVMTIRLIDSISLSNSLNSCVVDTSSHSVWTYDAQHIITRYSYTTSRLVNTTSFPAPASPPPTVCKTGAFDATSGCIYFGCTINILRVNSTDGRNARVDLFRVALSGITSMAVDPIHNHLYTGELIGVATRYNLPTPSSNSAQLVSLGVAGSSISGVVLDPYYNTTYWTVASSLVRIDMSRFEGPGNYPMVRLDLPSSTSGAGVMSPYVASPTLSDLERRAYVGLQDGSLAIVSVANCRDATTCSACVAVDPRYCKYWPGSGNCWYSLASARVPLQTGPVTTAENCPSLSAISPQTSSFPKPSNFFVTLSCPNCWLDSLQRFGCFLIGPGGRLLLAVSQMNTTTITCSVGGGTFTSPGLQTFGVAVRADGALPGNYELYTNEISLDLYDCGTADTSGCSWCNTPSRPECLWSVSRGLCQSSSVCSGTGLTCATGALCPSLTRLAPTATPFTGGPVAISCTNCNFAESTNLACIFNNTVTRATTSTSPSSIMCHSPNVTIPAGVSESSVPLRVIYARNDSVIVPYAMNALNFTYQDCELYATCGECTLPFTNNPSYTCVWCSETRRCTPERSTCPSTVSGQFIDPYVTTTSGCPAMVPGPGATLSGSLDGGTLINITVNNYVRTNETKCVFGTTEYDMYDYGVQYIVCQAPRQADSANGLSVPVSISWRSATWARATFSFSYYSCGGLLFPSCGVCTGYFGPECGWCATTTRCGSVSRCSRDAFYLRSSECPAFDPLPLPVSPAIGDGAGGDVLTVRLGTGLFVQNVSLGCSFRFDQTRYASSPAVVSPTGTTLTCVAPQYPNYTTVIRTEPIAVLEFSIVYTDIVPSKSYAKGGNNIFKYRKCYNGVEAPSCSGCLKTSPECFWCVWTSKCGGPTNVDCLPTHFINDTNQCPNITTASPREVFTGASLTNITLIGTNLLTTKNESLISCEVTIAPGNEVIMPAKRLNNTAFLCPNVPTLTTWTTNSSIGVRLSSIYPLKYAEVTNTQNAYSIGYYDCTHDAVQAAECKSCYRAERPECAWCISGTPGQDSCYPQTSCISPAGLFPTPCLTMQSISSSNTSTQSLIDITVQTVAGFLNLDPYYCEFDFSSPPGLSNITQGRILSANQIACPSPVLAQPSLMASAQLSILHNYVPLGYNSLPISFHPCGSLSLCGDCLQVDNCGWCAGDCVDMNQMDACPSGQMPQLTCPLVTQAEPLFSDAQGGGILVVSGDHLPEAGVYECLFEFGSYNLVAEGVYEANQVLCAIPALPSPAPPMISANVSLINRRAVETSTALVMEFFNCSAVPAPGSSRARVADTCTLCGLHPSSHCEWCLNTAKCQDTANGCDFWSPSRSCPNITSVTPAYAQHDFPTWITISGEFFMAPEPSPAPQVLEGLRVRAQKDFTFLCAFGSAESPAVFTYYPDRVPHGQFVCQSASTAIVGPVTPRILINGVPYATTSTKPFEFLECALVNTSVSCSSCQWGSSAKGCSWCMSEGKCTTAPACPDFSVSVVNRCPNIIAVSTLSEVAGTERSMNVSFSTDSQFPTNVNDTTLWTCMFINQENSWNNSAPVITIDMEIPDLIVFVCAIPAQISLSGGFQGFVTVHFGSVPFAVPYRVTYNRASDIAQPPSTNTATIVAVVVVVSVVFLVAFIFAGVVYVRYRRRTADYVLDKKPQLQPPKYMDIIVSESTFGVETLGNKHEVQILTSHFLPLVSEEVFFVCALCDSTQAADSERLAKALVFVLEGRHTTVHMLTALIVREVRTAESATNLFRNNSVASKVFSQFSKVIALPYLWHTLALIIYEINMLGAQALDDSQREEIRISASGLSPDFNASLDSGATSGMEIGLVQMSIFNEASLEVDPAKVHDPSDVSTNQLQLMLTAQKTFQAILKAAALVPPELRLVCECVKTEVAHRFPGQEHKAVSSLLFNKLLCPAITSPHIYGLLEEPPNDVASRYLVLLSKILQNLANGTLPGNKEEYMETMNNFITTNTPKLKELFDELAIPRALDTSNSHAEEIPKHVRDNALVFLWRHTKHHMDRITPLILASAPEPTGRELQERLRSVADTVNSYIQKST